MKKYFLNIMVALTVASGFTACSDSLTCEDKENSIFDTTSPTRNEFDEWVLKNFTYPYNVELTYKLNDIETDVDYTVVPADSAKAAKLAKIVKYMWYDAYDEVVGQEFLKKYSPRMIMMVGSGEYQSHGTVILGYATGSIKIALCNVNNLTDEYMRDIDVLNEWYLATLHHEFTHILNQKIAYDKSFEQISQGDYVSGNWYQVDDEDAYAAGFVRNYAMQEASEDFAETMADYITYTDTKWAYIKKYAGTTGYAKIEEKIAFIRSYMLTSYGVDIDQLRKSVQRRASELSTLDLDHLN